VKYYKFIKLDRHPLAGVYDGYTSESEAYKVVEWDQSKDEEIEDAGILVDPPEFVYDGIVLPKDSIKAFVQFKPIEIGGPVFLRKTLTRGTVKDIALNPDGDAWLDTIVIDNMRHVIKGDAIEGIKTANRDECHGEAWVEITVTVLSWDTIEFLWLRYTDGYAPNHEETMAWWKSVTQPKY
jgi:hypothetical protein